MKFTDSSSSSDDRYRVGRLDYILAGAGHVLILLAGLITFSSSASSPSGGDDAVMISMVTLSSQETSTQDAVQESIQEEIQEEVAQQEIDPQETEEIQETLVIEETQEDHIPEEVQEEIQEETPEETTQEDIQEIQEENPPDQGSEYVTVSSQGTVGAGAPGPGTYESRVFNAVRRGYRTSVEPERSYRVILTVHPDGTTEVEVVRTSGTSAFDRAVENALEIAQIPPMPPGRTDPVVINIEFLGPE